MTTGAAVTVRSLCEADREQLDEVADRAFSRKERVSFDPEKGHRLVATADGELVGGAVLRTVDVGGRRFGFTDWVFADPARSVPGTGSALRDAALAHFDESGRAGATFALFDLVPFARVYGSGGRVIHDHSVAWWALLAVIGAGPMVVLLTGLAA